MGQFNLLFTLMGATTTRRTFARRCNAGVTATSACPDPPKKNPAFRRDFPALGVVHLELAILCGCCQASGSILLLLSRASDRRPAAGRAFWFGFWFCWPGFGSGSTFRVPLLNVTKDNQKKACSWFQADPVPP